MELLKFPFLTTTLKQLYFFCNNNVSNGNVMWEALLVVLNLQRIITRIILVLQVLIHGFWENISNVNWECVSGILLS